MDSQDSDFILPLSMRPKSNRPKRWYQCWWGRIIVAFITIVVILGISLGFGVYRTISLIRGGQISAVDVLGPGVLPQIDNANTLVTSDDPSQGPKDAKVVIVEFADFQCPSCGQVYPVIKQAMKDYGGKVRLVFRDFPLSDTHLQSVIAAQAANCAFEQGKFWEMHDKIFENQNDLSEQAFKTYAVQLGLNSIQFDSCYSSQKYLPEIQSDFQDGYAAGVRSTPTFFIDGRKLEGAVPLATLESIIVSELSR